MLAIRYNIVANYDPVHKIFHSPVITSFLQIETKLLHFIFKLSVFTRMLLTMGLHGQTFFISFYLLRTWYIISSLIQILFNP